MDASYCRFRGAQRHPNRGPRAQQNPAYVGPVNHIPNSLEEKLTLFQKHLQDICRTLGLRIEIPFLVEFESGPIIAEALIKDLGAADGMLIFTSTEKLMG